MVKARNRIDERIYAGMFQVYLSSKIFTSLFVLVKKIKLKASANGGKPGEFDRGDKNDRKIFREVNALSRLSHRYIVRYFTTWVEESFSPTSNVPSDSDSDDDGTAAGLSPSSSRERTRTARIEELPEDPFSVDLSDLGITSGGTSFPSVYFTSGDVMSGSEDEGTDEEDEQAITNIRSSKNVRPSASSNAKPQGPLKLRTLYIQMVKPQMSGKLEGKN